MKPIFNKRVKGRKPEYIELNVGDIYIAPYQRQDVSMKVVNDIVKNFDWNEFDAPIVSCRNEKWWCVDGQHRLEALKILGIKTIYCRILTGLDYEGESDVFTRRNTNRRQLNPCGVFNGNVNAKHTDAVKINEVLQKNGLTYSKELKDKGYIKVYAIQTVRNIYRDGGEKHLDRVLNTLKESWYGEPAAFSCDMMQGLSTYFKNSRGVKDGILVSALERKLPKEVIATANFYAGENNICISSGSSKKPHVAKVIRDLYNAEKKRLEMHSII